MDFVAIKRGRNRKKRSRVKKRRREQKFEVKTGKRWGFISERILAVKEKLIANDTMQANSFWENYTVAQEWQKRLVAILVYTSVKVSKDILCN